MKSIFVFSFFLFVFESHLSAQQITAFQNKTLLHAEQGSIVELKDFLTEKFPLIKYEKIVLPGPQYIISDDPEYIRVPEAVAVKEKVLPGTVRLYVYNVNGVNEPQKMERKITALLKNTGKEKMMMRMLKYSSQKPSTNYFLCGKQGLADYFNSTFQTKTRTVHPGQAVAIDEQLEKNVVKYDELVHGIYEFMIDQPGEVIVLQTDLKTKSEKALARTPDVLNSRHTNAGRGLFGVSNYLVVANDTLDTKNGVKQLVVADGIIDPWIKGRDASTGQIATLTGNYGVMYDVELNWKSTDGKGLALVTWNARSASKWCGGMANTMITSAGKFNAGIIQLPTGELQTSGAPKAVLIQIFRPANNGSVQTIQLKYSPPGASCLPTPLVFIPIDFE